ncbi:MAG: hypothetical protein E6I08_13470 [Chloroflexi bacterium]|nr:MAG: hypothetical protein E6I08_13470 [Chloroflexota bacterium]
MAYKVESLLEMSQDELDRLFRESPAGDIPVGEAKGTAIIAPGTELSEIAAKFIHIFAWHGKVFDPVSGTLKNEILPIPVEAIAARVFKAPSWIDNNECVVLDYSQTSLIAHHIRDEIRLIAPGTYLGIVFWDRDRLINFALQFAAAPPA